MHNSESLFIDIGIASILGIRKSNHIIYVCVIVTHKSFVLRCFCLYKCVAVMRMYAINIHVLD